MSRLRNQFTILFLICTCWLPAQEPGPAPVPGGLEGGIEGNGPDLDPAINVDEDDILDLSGDWKAGKTIIAIDHAGEELTATYKSIGDNPFGIKNGDEAFSGTIDGRVFDGTIVLSVKKGKDGEVEKVNAPISLTLSEDNKTFSGNHELMKWDGKKKEFVKLKKKQKVTLTFDGGGEFELRLVKKDDKGLNPGRQDGTFAESSKAVYGEPFYVEIVYENKQSNNTVLVSLKGPESMPQNVICYKSSAGAAKTTYRSDPIYVTTTEKVYAEAEANAKSATSPAPPSKANAGNGSQDNRPRLEMEYLDPNEVNTDQPEGA